MNVSAEEPFKIIYSFYSHQILGLLVEAYAVSVDAQGKMRYQHQLLSSSNKEEFRSEMDKDDDFLISEIERMTPENLVRKHYAKAQEKRIKAHDFFLKIAAENELINKNKNAPETGSRKSETTSEIKVALQFMMGMVEKTMSNILPVLLSGNKYVFESDPNGGPNYGRRLFFVKEKPQVVYHFNRHANGTDVSTTIRQEGQIIPLQGRKSAIVLSKKPPFLLLDDKVYHFDEQTDISKLKPFFKNTSILVPSKLEGVYYKDHILPLIQHAEVQAVGFEIDRINDTPKALLKFGDVPTGRQAQLFQETRKKSQVAHDDDEVLVQEDVVQQYLFFELCFMYQDFQFKDIPVVENTVTLEEKDGQFYFYKVERQSSYEAEKRQLLVSHGLTIQNGQCYLEKSKAFEWIEKHLNMLYESGIELVHAGNEHKKYFLGVTHISLDISENHDWFDVRAIAKFGDFEIPLTRLRKYLLTHTREFQLPDGTTAVIPDSWFAKYADLFHFSTEKEGSCQLSKQHLVLVEELKNDEYARVDISDRLERFRLMDGVQDNDLPKGFNGELREYQKAGYDWLRFLDEYSFGGCLADDMGLGKTVQALAFLQYQKEVNPGQPSLLIMPTSLVYNWEKEAQRFTPRMRIFCYTGAGRVKDVYHFRYYDLIITSYGIARVDADVLSRFYFNYIILDESQAIKNPSSNIAHAVGQLKSRRRLVITGTPVENSTLDLWSQMNFVNPGLLGSQAYFRRYFQIPIERMQDEQANRKLHALIKPFILRRHKSQVAQELPEKTETIQYCTMSEEQAKRYEEVKSSYRNHILTQIEEKGIAQSQFLLLRGLTTLRQLANHPAMVEDEYTHGSGKMETILHKLEEVITHGNKVLIFSQFVKHLALLRQHLNERNIPYAYLDGATRDRQAQVEQFQQDKSVRVFLISLKAGGTGLNLTAADYVFLLDPWWNPAVEAQAIDRAHRIGQENKVVIYKFITQDTVEEKILALQQNKKNLAQSLITNEDGFMKKLTKDDIEEMLK